jgi:hypothetical protein
MDPSTQLHTDRSIFIYTYYSQKQDASNQDSLSQFQTYFSAGAIEDSSQLLPLFITVLLFLFLAPFRSIILLAKLASLVSDFTLSKHSANFNNFYVHKCLWQYCIFSHNVQHAYLHYMIYWCPTVAHKHSTYLYHQYIQHWRFPTG